MRRRFATTIRAQERLGDLDRVAVFEVRKTGAGAVRTPPRNTQRGATRPLCSRGTEPKRRAGSERGGYYRQRRRPREPMRAKLAVGA